MKHKLLLLFLTIISAKSYSQIDFEKGYFINNSGEKVECLIKNTDWRNNPKEFSYKLAENSKVQRTGIESIKEFGVFGVSKYIRSNVKMDRSSENLNNLSNDRNPKFKEEQLFLKVLLEGKANLFMYAEGSLKRFFYNNENSNIEQLVFKSYLKNYKTFNRFLKGRKNSDDVVGKNTKFKQQLWNNLKCSSFTIKTIENLEYREKSLINFFIKYNECNSSIYTTYIKKKEKDLFNLTLRPRINTSSAKIQNTNFSYPLYSDFGNQINFGLGIEAEFILLFNKNKWSILIEGNYQSFKANKTITLRNHTSSQELDANVTYNSIEFPIGLRHYFFLNNNSKIFANVLYIIDFTLKSSSIDFKRPDNTSYATLDVNSNNALGFGLGFKQNRFSLEARYITNRPLTFSTWKSEYKSASLIFGYSFL
ncbi:PorT family protein [Pontimicrobium aquaticum]|uniref:PorT family protein n=1 Tax=Pontimicrobium aquaticum TaxID=2565367 RepID=A0A4U0EWF9_9FLAO|nr:PorT family protein [Pontimicrobium aquaticum]TJY36311.1 PorT family protein [Pontimicrobium aquaticum]